MNFYTELLTAEKETMGRTAQRSRNQRNEGENTEQTEIAEQTEKTKREFRLFRILFSWLHKRKPCQKNKKLRLCFTEESVGRVRPRLLVTIFLVLLPIIYFYPAVKGDLVLMPGDGWMYSLLMRMLLGQMISQGLLPLWNPYTFAGWPFLATLQPGALYPPNWLFAVLPPAAAMNVVVITTYHITLFGAYRYARCLQFDRLSSLITATVFSFGGFMISHIEDTNYIAPIAWLPWILLAIEKLYLRTSWKWITLGASFVALQCFAGLPQATWQILLIGGPYAIFSLVFREERERRWRFAAAMAVMVVCGALLSAIQMLPALELQQYGERAQITYEQFSEFSQPPRRVLTLIFPYFFGGGFPPLYRVPGWDYWTLKWAYPYVSLTGLSLTLMAVFARWRHPMVRFWSVVTIMAMVLSLGSYLPFGLNHWVFRIPVHNLFRGPYRHSLEYTFAMAVLAGYGFSYLVRNEWAKTRRLAIGVALILTTLVSAVTALYLFFQTRIGTPSLPPQQANSLSNPEAFVPLISFALSIAALFVYARRRTVIAGVFLIAVVVADLSLFGQFMQWRTVKSSLMRQLADPPAIAAIKSREPDLNSYRVVNYSIWPFGVNYTDLNQANLAIARGVQSISGYDPMRLRRVAAIAGEINHFGEIRRTESFNLSHQGLNLLNVKYLLRERRDQPDGSSTGYDGLRFATFPLEINLGPGSRVELETDDATADQLGFISTMTGSIPITDGSTVARIKIHTKDGRVIERELLAGRDTSEWAYDHADVKPLVKHAKARIAESWDGGGFSAHRYLSRFTFDRAQIERIELEYALPEAALVILRASLYDTMTGQSTALDRHLLLPQERWRRIGRFGSVDLYENLKFLPRAWFVRRLEAKPSADVLRTIREGKLNDGSPFDPMERALFETEDFGGRPITLPAVGDPANAEVRIARYEPMRIELQTRNPNAGFLVLSETYYRGWEARIDGGRVPVERVNYTLRGISVPPGDHHIEFFFRAPSFRLGAKYSVLSIALLLAGALICRRRGWRS